jgi:hypothetical protein
MVLVKVAVLKMAWQSLRMKIGRTCRRHSLPRLSKAIRIVSRYLSRRCNKEPTNVSVACLSCGLGRDQPVARFNRAAINYLGKNAKVAMAKMRPHKADIVIRVTLRCIRVDIDRGASAHWFFHQQ